MAKPVSPVLFGCQHSRTFAVLSAAALLLGALIGTICAGTADPVAVTFALSSERAGVFSLVQRLFRELWYHGALVLVGFTMFGVYLVPVLCCARGFLAAYAISAVVRLLSGGTGVLYAWEFSGIVLASTIPTLLMIAVLSMCASSKLRRRAQSCERRQNRAFPSAGYLCLSLGLLLFSALCLTLSNLFGLM